jgi:molybdate transport system substrate-binding protein
MAVLAALLATACGGGDDGGPDRLVVSAAASLTEPLTACSRDFDGPPVRLSFAGSDELAAQIRRGVRPDVFAAADTSLPEQLAAERLVERPRVFASNRLVVAVASGSGLRRVEDLARPGVVVATGARSVPVGAYTRDVLGRLDPATGRRILANVRTEEPDVKGVVGKVAQGAADAGFVYATDVAAADGRLRGVALPQALRPDVAYGAAVVRGAADRAAARRYVDDLVDGACGRALRAAGFGPAPAP